MVTGGEEGIRTLETGQTVYSLSRGAPSTTRPPLHRRGYTRKGPDIKRFLAETDFLHGYHATSNKPENRTQERQASRRCFPTSRYIKKFVLDRSQRAIQINEYFLIGCLLEANKLLSNACMQSLRKIHGGAWYMMKTKGHDMRVHKAQKIAFSIAFLAISASAGSLSAQNQQD